MPIAKEPLKIGWVIVANTGGYVSQSAVDEYGWHDKVVSDRQAKKEATKAEDKSGK